jgi:hypothetical protein
MTVPIGTVLVCPDPTKAEGLSVPPAPIFRLAPSLPKNDIELPMTADLPLGIVRLPPKTTELPHSGFHTHDWLCASHV